MPTLKSALHASALLALSSGASAAFASPQLLNGPAGGHILYSPLAANSSRENTFTEGLHQLRGAFDGSPKLLSAIKSKDGNVMIAAFRAQKSGVPISGLSITTYDPSGHSSAAVVYDTPGHLTKSLPAMLKRLNGVRQNELQNSRSGGAGNGGPNFAAYEAASYKVKLTTRAFPDGTATVGVAPGFTPSVMSNVTFSAKAEDGAYTNLYTSIPMLDSSGSIVRMQSQMHPGQTIQIPGRVVMDYTRDPFAAWSQFLAMGAAMQGNPNPNPQLISSKMLSSAISAFTRELVTGTITLHGEPYVFSGILQVGPPPSTPGPGGWQLQISMCGAPQAHANTDMPALLAMQRSEQVNIEAMKAEIRDNIAAATTWMKMNKAAGDAERDRAFASSMHNAASAQDSIDKSAAGFIHYIQGNSVVEHDPTGSRGTLDNGIADALVKADPQNFHIVPLGQYVKGRDY